MNLIILNLFLTLTCGIKTDNLKLSKSIAMPNIKNAFITSINRPSIQRIKKPLNDTQVDIEPKPYSSGYIPQLSPGTFRYCGHKLDRSIRPINNYVLIVKNNFHEISQGGVYIGTKRNQEFIGRVVAVGPGKFHQETGVVTPISVKVGDMVLFEPPEEDPVLMCDNEKCALITDDRIYAKIESTDFSGPTTLVAERIRPLSDRVFVRIIDTPNKTESGLVIARPEEKQDNIIRAEIVSIGPGSYTEDGKLSPIQDLHVGDHILFSDSTADGGEFSCNQKQHAFVRYQAILAKL